MFKKLMSFLLIMSLTACSTISPVNLNGVDVKKMNNFSEEKEKETGIPNWVWWVGGGAATLLLLGAASSTSEECLFVEDSNGNLRGCD